MSEPWKLYQGGGFMSGGGKKNVTRDQLEDFYTNYADAPHKVEKISQSLSTYKNRDRELVKALCEKYPDASHFWEQGALESDPASTPAADSASSGGSHDAETVTWMRGCICHPFVDNARKLISFLWILTNILVLCFVFAAIAVAASDDCQTKASDEHCSHAFGFYAVYVMFTALILCIGGTRIMRRHRNSFFVGLFLGVSFMMSLNMFVGTFLFASDEHGSAGVAAAVFCFLLFLSYGLFSIALFIHRDAIIKQPGVGDGADAANTGDDDDDGDDSLSQTPQTSVYLQHYRKLPKQD